jgi:hypothetical protein
MTGRLKHALTSVGIGLAGLLATLALAAPPPEPDPLLSLWFKSLSRPWRPGSGATVNCCDIADCRVTVYREVGNHYEVLIDERFPGVEGSSWQPVAPEAILDYKDNPTGGAVACWHQGEVLCFVRADET